MFSCSEEEVDCEERNVRARTAKLLLSVQVAGSKTDTSQHWTGLMSHQALMGVFLPFQNQPISTIFIWKFRNPGWNPVEHSTRLLEWWKTSGPKLASLEGLKALRASVLRFAIFFFWESQDFVFCDLIHWLFWDGVKIFERSSCVAIICPVPLDVCLEFYDRAAVAWVVPGALPDLVDSRSLSSASRGWFWRVRDSLLGGIISRRAVQCSGLWLWYGVLYERNS